MDYHVLSVLRSDVRLSGNRLVFRKKENMTESTYIEYKIQLRLRIVCISKR